MTEARVAVEEQVIRLAAQRIGKAALARLGTLVLDREAMPDDPVSLQISDREFHSTLYTACGPATPTSPQRPWANTSNRWARPR